MRVCVCAHVCVMIWLPNWVKMWKMTYMHFSFCRSNGWKIPQAWASPSPNPSAKTVVIISYVLKIWHHRFIPSFHLASVNDRGLGLSWAIIYCVVAQLKKVALHHKMSSCRTFHLNIFISLWNLGWLEGPSMWSLLSSLKFWVQLRWRIKSDSLWTLAPSCAIVVLFPQKNSECDFLAPGFLFPQGPRRSFSQMHWSAA